ncbi:unnamed protein product [Mesocestoides corti]|nr:unnamed protein product [Mesocestoides corti]
MKKLQDAFQAASSRNPEEEDAYESGVEETSDFGLVFSSDISSGSEAEDEEEAKSSSDEESVREGGDNENADEAYEIMEEGCEESNCTSTSSEEGDQITKKCSSGYYAFLSSCLERKIMIKEFFSCESNVAKKNVLLTMLGPEHKMAAVCNFRVRRVDNKKRVIHITFLSVRKHLRRLGIGTRIIEIIKTPQMSGHYDAMVVHADLNATEFFANNGFSGDPLLNKQWASFAGEYVNCLLMTYFPPLSFGASTTNGSKLLKSIDKSIDDWLVATGNVHQMQYTLCKRLRAEVVRLQNQLLSQDSLIQVLKREVVKQAHLIDALRARAVANGQRDGDESLGLSLDAISFSTLPPPMNMESRLSLGFKGVTFKECAGDMD